MSEKEKYSPDAIEKKWQHRWQDDQLYRAKVDWSKPKHYAVTMLPYPSGDLHIGHWFAMTPSDARARYMRMKGFNVLFPMGFDAFGLPAENAAVQRGVHPAEWTMANMERMRGQLRSMGAMFDWERQMVSCLPEYYHWTEWFFKLFYENDLAYRGEALVNWSDALQTVLANEQVIDGKDERLGQPVIQKMMTQWFFRYTRYTEELLKFDNIDWPEPIKIMQTNWIGRSEGARVIFKTETDHEIEIYTTRPDTLWGATFMVLAPEHDLVDQLTTEAHKEAVEAYRADTVKKTEIERLAEGKEKTGVFIGAYAINPVNGARVPIWIADYVMSTYGTGAIMAVPAHDHRDFSFAKKFGLEIIPVIQPEGETFTADTMEEAYDGAGKMVNSGRFDGTVSNNEKGRKNPAINAVLDWITEEGFGRESVNYRLRDWLISRQRYWGSPIPVIYRQDGTIETVPDDQLPVMLPTDIDFFGAVGNPLGRSPSFVETVDSEGNPARRETDTMDTFMCSSWYHLRYLSPHYDQAPFDPEEAAYWLPVDVYTGGAEHATMHLLYTRWFNKALRDHGVFDDALKIATEHGRDTTGMVDEPMLRLRNQGQVLGGERVGDYILATGEFVGNKLVANHIEVIGTAAKITQEYQWNRDRNSITPAQNQVVGEIFKRTENLITVRTPAGENATIEAAPNATIDIPFIPGENNVNQLFQHLEVQRMSKSKRNVVNPDELVAEFGADAVRAYLMFSFDWIKGGPWDTRNITGVIRWLNEVWDIAMSEPEGENGDPKVERQVERRTHQAIKKVEAGLEDFSFNTSIAELMSLKNEVRPAVNKGQLGKTAFREAMRSMLLLMAPFTPHITEELWNHLGFGYSIHQQLFPQYDAEKAAEAETTLVIMRNGKPLDHAVVPVDITEEEAKAVALQSESVQRALNGNEPKKVIYIAGRFSGAQWVEPKINIVV